MAIKEYVRLSRFLKPEPQQQLQLRVIKRAQKGERFQKEREREEWKKETEMKEGFKNMKERFVKSKIEKRRGHRQRGRPRKLTKGLGFGLDKKETGKKLGKVIYWGRKMEKDFRERERDDDDDDEEEEERDIKWLRGREREREREREKFKRSERFFPLHTKECFYAGIQIKPKIIAKIS